MNNKQLAHVWAQWPDRIESGKAANMFFDGPSIFSYGRHFEIARFMDKDTVFFTTRDYSSTTAKHKSYTLSAIPGHVRVFHVPSFEDHPGNIKFLIERLEIKKCAALMAVKWVDDRIDSAKEAADDLTEYYSRFSRKAKLPETIRRMARKYKDGLGWTEKEREKLDRKREAARERGEREALENEKRREQLEKDNAEALDKWERGEGQALAAFYQLSVRLRLVVRDNEPAVETSRGAVVPFEQAQYLFNQWREYRESSDSSIKNRLEGGQFGPGYQIGHFRLEKLQADAVKIGCHVITWEAAERFFKGYQEKALA